MPAANGHTNGRLDVAEVKRAASGQWRDVLSSVAGIDAGVLDGRNHPCPKCGGTDRFRYIDDVAGAVLCNQCFVAGNGDGLAAVQWALGCDFPESVRLVAEHLHLAPATNGRAKSTGLGRVVETYDYHDAGGELVFQAVRYEPKDFRQRRPDGAGGWVWGVKGCPVLPYHLPELLRGDDAPAFIPEGERDVHSLESIGLFATCNAGGAGKWKAEHAEHLRGRDVIVLPDNDQPGREHAAKVARSLVGIAKSIRIVALPGLPEKGDVSDWIDNHGDAATPEVITKTLMRLVAAAEPYQPNDASDDATEAENPYRRQPIEKFNLGELIQAYPRLKPPVVDGLFREGETVNVVSVSKVGKSWLVYYLALSIVLGRDLFGRFPTAMGRVLLIDNELHRPTLASRIPTVATAMGITIDEVAEHLEVWPLRGSLRSLEELGEEFDKIEPGDFQVVIMDAKFRFVAAGASENDNASETLFYNTLDHYAEKTGAAFVLVHHSSKGNQSDKRVTDVGAGAGAQSRAADAHLVLREHEDADTVVLEAAVRSFAPVEPLALRWSFPLWTPDTLADPERLKGRLGKGQQAKAEEDHRDKLKVVDAIRKAEGRVTNKQLRKLVGMGREKINRLLDLLEADGQIESEQVTKYGNRCDEFWINED